MDTWQAPFHIEFILSAVANALLNLPSHDDSKDQSRSWFPCEIKVRKIGSDAIVRFQPTSHGSQGYEFVRTAPGSEVTWHHAFRVAPGDLFFVAILLVIYDGLLQLQCRQNSQSQHCTSRCDTDFQVTFGIWLSNRTLHCDTIETDDFLSQESVHSEVTEEQCQAISQCTLWAPESKASHDAEHQNLPPGIGGELWPFPQCLTKYSILGRNEGSGNDVCYEDSNATIHCCQDVEMQEIGDEIFPEIESESFGAVVEKQQTSQSPSLTSLPKDVTKPGSSRSAWEIIPYQSSSHSSAWIQQDLNRLLQQHLTVNDGDARYVSMLYVIYLPELDRFKIGSVKQRRLDGRLESFVSFREEGCMRRIAQMKKECDYKRIELSYQSEPLETDLIRRLERVVYRALSAVADRICCLETKPKHTHIGFFDAEIRVIRYIIEKSLDLIREEMSDGSDCSNLTKSNLKAMDLPQDVRTKIHNIEAVSPGWKHPVNTINRFCTALRPESAHHLLDYYPAQLSLEDQHMILHILDIHRLKHEKTSVNPENLFHEAEVGKKGEEIIGLITFVDGVPALDDWKVLPKSKSHEADDPAWEPLLNLLPGSGDQIRDFIAECSLKSRCHEKLLRYLRLYQQLSQLH